MNPLVTISIPIYKCEDFLEKCLDSVRLQTYPNIEVSLINDQTPDHSVQIAENYISDYKLENWKIIHLEKNSGLSVVRNKGIETANGKYIFFVDSDDSISHDCIEKLVVISEKESSQMTVAQIECIRLETGEKYFCLGKIKLTETINRKNEALSAFAFDLIPSSACNKLSEVDFLRKNEIYFVPGLFAQDELWSFHFCLKAETVAFCSDTTYEYVLHSNSVIHNRGKRHFDNWLTIGQHIDKALKEEKDSNRKKMILSYLTRYKDMTLIMNWRAQKNEEMWMETYRNYKKLGSLGLFDYFSKAYSNETKKKDFLMRLPTGLAMEIFKRRWKN